MSSEYEKECQRRYDRRLDRMSDLEFAEYSLRFEIGRMWWCLAFLILTGAGWLFLPDESGRHLMVVLFGFTAFCMFCGVLLIHMDKKELAELKTANEHQNPQRTQVTNDVSSARGRQHGVLIGPGGARGSAGVVVVGDRDTVVYSVCASCGHSQSFTEVNFAQLRCPKCRSDRAFLGINKKPEGYKS